MTMHLYCSVLINQKARRTLSYNNHALVLFCVNQSEGKENFVSWASTLVVITSSNNRALVPFWVDQPRAENFVLGAST